MARCAVLDDQGYLRVATQDTADMTTCQLVVMSPNDLPRSPFDLTLVEAGQIGGAILLVWVTAWIFRQVFYFLRAKESEYE